MIPLGITLHYIDTQVDMGEIISVVPTNIYKDDTFETLARRHYENEINVFSDFAKYLENPVNQFDGIGKLENMMRMPIEKEKEMIKLFPKYVEKYGG
jgi:phosphoribosylglycinamide formyltransferase-1